MANVLGHPVFGHALILAGAGVGAIASAVAAEFLGPAPGDAPVAAIISPARASPSVAAGPLAQPSPPSPPPGDRAALARELQRELKRVGCYEGEINGTWGPQSRKAMKAFTDQANARLPIEQPDLILLTMVQGQRERACTIPAAAAPADADPVAQPSAMPPRLVSPPVEAKRPPPRPEGKAAAQARIVDVPPAIPGPPAPAPRNPSRLVPDDAPIPPAAVYDRAADRTPRPDPSGPSGPPKFVRTLIKGVQNVFASLGVP
jgi:peptidoglycan hydrolase-like protein with peptidoglycan-binding domain